MEAAIVATVLTLGVLTWLLYCLAAALEPRP